MSGLIRTNTALARAAFLGTHRAALDMPSPIAFATALLSRQWQPRE